MASFASEVRFFGKDIGSTIRPARRRTSGLVLLRTTWDAFHSSVPKKDVTNNFGLASVQFLSNWSKYRTSKRNLNGPFIFLSACEWMRNSRNLVLRRTLHSSLRQDNIKHFRIFAAGPLLITVVRNLSQQFVSFVEGTLADSGRSWPSPISPSSFDCADGTEKRVTKRKEMTS